MSGDNRELKSAPGDPSSPPIDFPFLAAQTFDDEALAREILVLFVAQAKRVLARLPGLPPREQGDAAHLLKGSARGIGAWPAAVAADSYEGAGPADRPRAYAVLTARFEAAIGVIEAHLGKPG